jgi:hypothetical protein
MRVFPVIACNINDEPKNAQLNVEVHNFTSDSKRFELSIDLLITNTDRYGSSIVQVAPV